MLIFNTTVVGVIRGRVKSAITPCTAVEVELNRYLIENDYIISAPFKEIQCASPPLGQHFIERLV